MVAEMKSKDQSGRMSTQLAIPHTEEPNITLAGILQQVDSGESTSGRSIALILHGTLGHKDYLFQKRLAASLPLDSFRFDFRYGFMSSVEKWNREIIVLPTAYRGNHESDGVWKIGDLANDLEDIQVVVDYLKINYGYIVELVVGHSRGSIVAFRWLSATKDGQNVPAFVNISGRYRMPKIMELPNSVIWQGDFIKQGYSTWNVTVAKRHISAIIKPEDLQKFVDWDTSFVFAEFPSLTDVLTIHGLSDTTVPPYDALIYASALSHRNPGTHTLHLMEKADHNYTGHQDEVVDSILQWWSVRKVGKLSTGIWVPEIIKNKL